jgi:hypothetical protein
MPKGTHTRAVDTANGDTWKIRWREPDPNEAAEHEITFVPEEEQVEHTDERAEWRFERDGAWDDKSTDAQVYVDRFVRDAKTHGVRIKWPGTNYEGLTFDAHVENMDDDTGIAELHSIDTRESTWMIPDYNETPRGVKGAGATTRLSASSSSSSTPSRDGADDDESAEGGANDGREDREDGSDAGEGTGDEAFDHEAKPAAKRKRKADGKGSGREAKRARAQTRKKGKCAHGRQRYRCKACGGSSICAHGRQRSTCKECGGASICAHGRRRSTCKECGGASICAHGRERHRCKQCGGAGICAHGRQRNKCKECGGASICAHGRERHRCKECGATTGG